MNQYRLISKTGEGSFSEVIKAQHITNGNYVALKCMKSSFNSIEQVNKLREIQALKKLSPHENIIKLSEVLYDDKSKKLALVFELMDKNLYEYIRGRKIALSPVRVKTIIYQVLKAVGHMHKNGIFHRDIKPENILLLGESVKLADFGSCKGCFSPHPHTEYISTRWYRSPECLMTDGYYDAKMDVWGIGCVLFEIITFYPLFPGDNEIDQIHKIHQVFGTPPQYIIDRFKKHASHMKLEFPAKQGSGIEKLLPNETPDLLDLLKKLLTYDPDKRITAAQALAHPYFADVVNADAKEDLAKSLMMTKVPKTSPFEKISKPSDQPAKIYYEDQLLNRDIMKMHSSIQQNLTFKPFPKVQDNVMLPVVTKPKPKLISKANYYEKKQIEYNYSNQNNKEPWGYPKLSNYGAQQIVNYPSNSVVGGYYDHQKDRDGFLPYINQIPVQGKKIGMY